LVEDRLVFDLAGVAYDGPLVIRVAMPTSAGGLLEVTNAHGLAGDDGWVTFATFGGPPEPGVQRAVAAGYLYASGTPRHGVIALGGYPHPFSAGRVARDDSVCRTPSASGFQVCGDAADPDTFLGAYLAAGPQTLGLPISTHFDERRADGSQHMVQYFERGLLEWHPEAPVGAKVVVMLLGENDTPAAPAEVDGVYRMR
jgi:hypothetical protein